MKMQLFWIKALSVLWYRRKYAISNEFALLWNPLLWKPYRGYLLILKSYCVTVIICFFMYYVFEY